MTPRQQTKKVTKVPHLEGWKFFDVTFNGYMFCQKCRQKPKAMFYRQVTDAGSLIPRTEAICPKCAGVDLAEYLSF